MPDGQLEQIAEALYVAELGPWASGHEAVAGGTHWGTSFEQQMRAEYRRRAGAVLPALGHEPAQEPPMTITFVLRDEETDGVAIKHNGQVGWQESSFDRLSQYFRHAPPTEVPVVLRIEQPC